MVNWWTPQNQKWASVAGMGLSGYFIIAQAFANIPPLPALITKPIFGQVSILTVAGALSVYGIYYIMNKT